MHGEGCTKCTSCNRGGVGIRKYKFPCLINIWMVPNWWFSRLFSQREELSESSGFILSSFKAAVCYGLADSVLTKRSLVQIRARLNICIKILVQLTNVLETSAHKKAHLNVLSKTVFGHFSYMHFQIHTTSGKMLHKNFFACTQT